MWILNFNIGECDNAAYILNERTFSASTFLNDYCFLYYPLCTKKKRK